MDGFFQTETAVLLISAPFFGSFLGVLVARWPDGRAILFGRSACAACGHKLAPRDLVPVVSWAACNGRCRYCAAPIGLFPLGIELAALIVALWSVAVLPGSLAWTGCLLGWPLLAAALIDSRCQLLPDVLTLPLIPAGLFVASRIDPSTLPDHVLGAAAGYFVLAALARGYSALRGREGLGLGDAKLLAAAGAWVSWAALPSVILLAATGALAMMAARGVLNGKCPDAYTAIAFGPYLAGSLWLVWLYGPITVLSRGTG